MRRQLLELAAVACFALTVSCATHPAPDHATGAPELVIARQAAVAIGSLQHAAIELNKLQSCTPAPCHALLSNHDTGVVVDAATEALSTMRAVPAGWLATADAALNLVERRLEAAGRAQFAPYLAGARATLTSLKGSTP